MTSCQTPVPEYLYRRYVSEDRYFPLIASVLLGTQDGRVLVDRPTAPRQAYVEHAFGFAQLFGVPDSTFENSLAEYLLKGAATRTGKVRLYGTYVPGFLGREDQAVQKSERQRFVLDEKAFLAATANPATVLPEVTLSDVQSDTLSAIENAFGVVRRFWRTPDEFLANSHAVVVNWKGHPVSICYSAAEGDGCVEIDVVTLPTHRKLGLARRAVVGFIDRCLTLGLRPCWDCFTNNAGSMNLCRTVGFAPLFPAYPFFTIGRGSA